MTRPVIVDTVFHPWNLSPENQNPAACAQLDAVYASHRLSLDDTNRRYNLSEAEIFSDIDFDALASAEFVESPVDLAVIHSLPCLGFTKGNVTDPDRATAWRDRHPDRFRLYATVGTPLARGAVEELRRQVDSFHVDGLKLYPALYYDNRAVGWRLDGEDFATPLLETVRDMGITRVAIHKALWLKPAPRSAFEIDDMDSPLDRFADMTFEIVHGGTAFLDQTIEWMRRRPRPRARCSRTVERTAARSDGGMTPVERVRARVAAIPEPCGYAMGRPTTLGAMGLIEEIAFADGHTTVTLCLTDAACAHFAAMRAFIADRLAELPEVTSVEVRQALETLWSPDRMADA